MKAEVEIVLEGNIRLPVSCKMDSLKDVAALGNKLVGAARNARRMFPDMAALPVKSLKVSTKDK